MMWRAAFFLGRHNEQSVAPMDGLVTAPIVEAFLRENARYAILPGSVAPLRATLDAYERRGSRVVLVLAPYHSAVLRYRFAREAFLKQAQAALGRPILDLSTALRDDQDFADPVHMNESGRRRLTPLLAQATGGKCPALAAAMSSARP